MAQLSRTRKLIFGLVVAGVVLAGGGGIATRMMGPPPPGDVAPTSQCKVLVHGATSYLDCQGREADRFSTGANEAAWCSLRWLVRP